MIGVPVDHGKKDNYPIKSKKNQLQVIDILNYHFVRREVELLFDDKYTKC